MDTTNLQIPLTKDLKMSAQQAAFDMGFSSLQELVRIILKKISTQTVQISFVDEERLSPKAAKRYAKISEEIKKGINVTETNSLEELFEKLK
ncbi:MAG: hypothetical protein AAB437_04210 [Patescibacteria group bacterium]